MQTNVVGRRVAAFLIDFVPYALLTILVFFAVAKSAPEGTSLEGSNTVKFTGDGTTRYLEGGSAILFLLAVFVVWVAWRTAMTVKIGKTGGKSALGIEVVDVDGNRPTVRQAASREALWVVDGLFFPFIGLVGFIQVVVSEDKIRLGDRVAKTRVISSVPAEAPAATAVADAPAAPAQTAAAVPAPGGPPPGWYADPEGTHRLRWWDGAVWTDNTSD